MKNSKLAKKTLDFHITSVRSQKDADGSCVIAGMANTKDKDRVGDVVMPEAFEATLATYLKNPILLANHDWNTPIGRVIQAQVTDDGLYIKAVISETRQDIKTMIREKVLSTFSIGYNELDSDFDEGSKTKYIKALELLEVSVVSVPANTEATFTVVDDQPAAAPAQDDESTDEAAPAAEPEKSAAKSDSYFEKLAEFVTTIKSVCGEIDRETVIAACDYFSEKGDTMTKDEVLKLLRGEKAAAPKPTAKSKKDGAAPAEAPSTEGGNTEKPEADESETGDALQDLSAKVDAIAQALASIMEKLEKLDQESADSEAEANPDEAKPSDSEKPANDEDDESEDDSEKSAMKCEKCGGNMVKDDVDGDGGAMQCEKCGHKAEDPDHAPEEMSDEEVEKQLAELEKEIQALSPGEAE